MTASFPSRVRPLGGPALDGSLFLVYGGNLRETNLKFIFKSSISPSTLKVPEGNPLEVGPPGNTKQINAH